MHSCLSHCRFLWRLIGVPTEKVDAWLKDMFNNCKLIQPPYTPITEVCTYSPVLQLLAPGGRLRRVCAHELERWQRVQAENELVLVVAEPGERVADDLVSCYLLAVTCCGGLPFSPRHAVNRALHFKTVREYATKNRHCNNTCRKDDGE